MTIKEYDVEFGEHRLHCYEGGAGMPLLLLHGIGPGTSITANFGLVLAPLAERFHIFGCDLVGFGGSSRKAAQPYFDFPLWIAQAQFLLDRMPAGDVGIIGHSMGGAIALKLGSTNRRVRKIITSGGAGGPMELNQFVETFWTTPRSRNDIRNAMKVGMHNHSAISDELIEDRFRAVSQGDYIPYFEAMLGGDKQKMLDHARMTATELSAIEAEVLIMHGRNDLPCPAEQTALQIYRHIPKGDLLLLHDCGHQIPREYPKTLLTMAELWFGSIAA
jgi:2-hydroxymuconate-semialdehyde hydrolase